MHYENEIYNKLGEASKGQYQGGYWQYYTLSNGGFYMELDDDMRFDMECLSNYYNGEMSAQAASIAVNLCVQNAFAWQIEAEKFSEHFYQLRVFATGHEEANTILGFID